MIGCLGKVAAAFDVIVVIVQRRVVYNCVCVEAEKGKTPAKAARMLGIPKRKRS